MLEAKRSNFSTSTTGDIEAVLPRTWIKKVFRKRLQEMISTRMDF
jgi:hypothetical protein